MSVSTCLTPPPPFTVYILDVQEEFDVFMRSSGPSQKMGHGPMVILNFLRHFSKDHNVHANQALSSVLHQPVHEVMIHATSLLASVVHV